MKKTFKDYLYMLSGNGFARGAAFLNSIIIARKLGPEEFGRFSLFYIAMILTWQIPQAFDQTFVKYAKESSSVAEKNDFLKISVFFKILYSIILLFISYPLTYFLAVHAFQKPDTNQILIAGLICGIFLSFLMSFGTVFQEREEFSKFAFIPALFSGSILLILLLSKAIKFHIPYYTRGLIYIFLTVSIILGTLSIVMLFKKTGKLFPLNINVFKKSFSLGRWIVGVTVVYFIFQRLDIFVLTRYVSFKDIGIYSVAVQLIMIISFMYGSLSAVLLPKSFNAVKSKSQLNDYKRISFYTGSMLTFFVVVLIIFGPYIIQIFYGEEYLHSGLILRILLIGYLFTSFYLPFSFLFYALDDAKTRFLLEFFKILLVLTLLLYFIPANGIYGAAISISFALVLNTIISLAVLKYKVNYKVGFKKVVKC